MKTPTGSNRYYLYIIANHNKQCLHVGFSKDIIKTLKFYEQLPSLFFNPGEILNGLVYFEEVETEEATVERFKFVTRLTDDQKRKLIEHINPDWASITEQMLKNHIENPNFI